MAVGMHHGLGHFACRNTMLPVLQFVRCKAKVSNCSYHSAQFLLLWHGQKMRSELVTSWEWALMTAEGCRLGPYQGHLPDSTQDRWISVLLGVH